MQFSFIRVTFVGGGEHPQLALQPIGRYMRKAVWFRQPCEVADKIILTCSVGSRPQDSVVVMCHTLLKSSFPFKKTTAFPSPSFLRACGEN